MGALDFTEIPGAAGGPDRDQFELFARDVLSELGFRVIQHPDRGPDAGRDLIVEEDRVGPGGKSRLRWLVSCKHKAHSGNSVTPADESNVIDRLTSHDCSGFVAFYSTVPSSGLAAVLNKLAPRYDYLQLDSAAIETRLLSIAEGRAVAARYMPKSFNAWIRASQSVANIEPIPDPHRSFDRFFMREPHIELSHALLESRARELPIFAVVYDETHPQLSDLDYALGAFLRWRATKKLVDENFVPLVVSSRAKEIAKLVPEDDPLENCRWIVMDHEGNVLRSEGVYANADEGWKRVREVLAARSPGSN